MGEKLKAMDRIEACNLHLRKVEEALNRIEPERRDWTLNTICDCIESLRVAVNGLMIEVREIRRAKR